MIKRTLFFGSPAYLSTRHQQLVVDFPKESGKEPTHIPIEDIGVVVLEHPQITMTHTLVNRLVENQCTLISCDAQHMPSAVLQPLVGHSLQTERYRHQWEASVTLKKALWQQTIQAKIKNQALHLEKNGVPARKLHLWTKEIKSGDSENHESRAAVFYWENIFPIADFVRGQKEAPPNHLLNYGYAILRAMTARALIGSGLMPGVGIWHRNKYNPYPLADDIMEPYRVYVDRIVRDIVLENKDYRGMTPSFKQQLLQLPVIDVRINSKISPLMIALTRTTHSLYECMAGHKRKIVYPVYE